MPRNYTSRTGDTIERIAIKHDGSASNAANIQKANPHVADPNRIPEGTLIRVPGIPGVTDRASPPAAPLVGGDKDRVVLEIDGEQIDAWVGASLGLSMDTVADTFEISGPWNPDDEAQRKRYKPFGYQKCTLYIGDEKVITGTALKVKPLSAPGRKSISLAGYSLPGVLADCQPSADSYPLEWKDATLDTIAKQLIDPFGLSLVTEDTGPAFARVAMPPTSKIYDYLISLCHQRGILIASDPSGSLLLQKAGTGGARAKLIGGKFPISGEETVQYDGQKRYDSVTALGDGWGNDKKFGTGAKGVAADNSVGTTRPHVFRAQDIGAGELIDVATAKLGRQVATAIQYQVPVTGWRDTDGNLWKPNTRVVYNSPGVMVYEDTEFLIRNVRLQKTAGSLSAVLTLVFPEAYSGEIRSEYPWG